MGRIHDEERSEGEHKTETTAWTGAAGRVPKGRVKCREQGEGVVSGRNAKEKPRHEKKAMGEEENAGSEKLLDLGAGKDYLQGRKR